MRPSTLLLAVGSVALAAPAPNFISNLLSAEAGIKSTIETTIKSAIPSLNILTAAVSKLGATLQTDAAKHGSIWNADSIVVKIKDVAIKRFSHTISWTKQDSRSYIDWSTYKANGVNLGAWLEQ
jgi:glucan 1,3-beta-glucosidase